MITPRIKTKSHATKGSVDDICLHTKDYISINNNVILISNLTN